MEDIYSLTRKLKHAEEKISELEERLDNLAKQLLHVFDINNLKNPYN